LDYNTEVFFVKRYLWLIVALLLIVGAGSGCLNSKAALKVGTDAAYAPFEYVDKNGKYAGFDIELIQMVADELGRKMEIQNIGWDGIIPGLMNGNYDCLISAMTITPEREKQIDFSTPYFSIKQAIVVKAENTTVKGPADLAGKTVTVQNGTTGDLYASKIANVKMKRFDNNPLAVQDLSNNNADAAVMDDLVAYDTIKSIAGLKVIEIRDIEPENYGIGIKKGNDDLREKINKAIETLKSNGKLDELIKKYKS